MNMVAGCALWGEPRQCVIRRKDAMEGQQNSEEEGSARERERARSSRSEIHIYICSAVSEIYGTSGNREVP